MILSKSLYGKKTQWGESYFFFIYLFQYMTFSASSYTVESLLEFSDVSVTMYEISD